MFTKNRADSSAEKLNQVAQSMTTLTLSQRGSVLIWIIGAMVIMAVLGTGMLYLTTTSTYNQLFFGSHSDAYCAAESGGRYAMSVIRDAYSVRTSSSVMSTILSTAFDGKTFILSNGNSFEIKNVSISTASSTDGISFSSVGTVGSGFMQAKRQMSYKITPANQGGYKLPVNNKEPDMNNFNTKTPWAGTFTQENGAMTVTATKSEVDVGNKRGDQYEYRGYSEYTKLDFSAYQNAQGGSLGYDAQVKVKAQTDYFMTGLAFRAHPLYSQTGDTSAAKLDPRGFNLSIIRSAGKLDVVGGEGLSSELIDYNNDGLVNLDTTWTAGDYYIVLWMDKGGQDPLTINGVNDNTVPMEYLLAYKKLDSTSGIIPVLFTDNGEGDTPTENNKWLTQTNWTLTNSSSSSPTHSWYTDITGRNTTSTLNSKTIDCSASTSANLIFYYKLPTRTNTTPSVQICTSSGCTTLATSSLSSSSSSFPIVDNNWHKVDVPIPGTYLKSSTYIKFYAQNSNSTSAHCTWYIDDVQLVGVNKNGDTIMPWSTLLVRLLEKNLTTGDDSTRRNVIAAYYSTTTANSAVDHVNAYDNNRTGSNPVGTFNWPATSGSDKNFTEIQWDWIRGCGSSPSYAGCINTAVLYTDVTDGSGNTVTPGTVLKTKFYRTRNSGETDGWGSFVVTSGYSELALTVFSANGSGKLFFDDFAVNISNGAGANGTGQVIQYP